MLFLSLLNKRYYSSLLGTLNSIRLDRELVTKQNKNKPNKTKNVKNKQEQTSAENVEVEVNKIPLHVFAKNQQKSKDIDSWVKIN